MWLWVKNRVPPNRLPWSVDQNLRFSGGSILTHTHADSIVLVHLLVFANCAKAKRDSGGNVEMLDLPLLVDLRV